MKLTHGLQSGLRIPLRSRQKTEETLPPRRRSRQPHLSARDRVDGRRSRLRSLTKVIAIAKAAVQVSLQGRLLTHPVYRDVQTLLRFDDRLERL